MRLRLISSAPSRVRIWAGQGYQRGVLIGLPFELFVNIFQKLHVGVQLFSVLKLWIEGLFPYYNIRKFL